MPKDLPHVYIGRGTPWGNEFKVGEGYSQGEAANAYRRKLARYLAGKDPKAVKLVMDLAGVENIVCSCAPRDCHGDCFKEIWDIIRGEDVPVLEGIRKWVKLNGYSYGPSTDGRDHINMYSKAKTALGRKLTNMSGVPIHIRGVGQFMSMEGVWYYLSTGKKHLDFLDMNGFEAKKFGRTLPKVPNDRFKDEIRYHLWQRFEQNPTLKESFAKSVLPFKHYYFYGDDDDRTVVYPPYDWITAEMELLRDLYSGRKKACIIAGSRDLYDKQLIDDAVKASGFEFDVVVCGTAKGMDTAGEDWGKENGKIIRYFKPDWELEGKSAGFTRNADMGKFGQMAIIGIKNKSKGSENMYELMHKSGKPVHRVDV